MSVKRGYIGSMLGRYRRSARLRKVEWHLSPTEFASLVSQECAYCGAEPRPRFFSVWIHKERRSERHESKERLNGIDRVNNAIGYTRENSVSCCGTCNRLKADMSLDEFMAHIAKIVSRAI